MTTQADLLALLARTLDTGWLDPIVQDPDSKAVVDSLTAIFAKTAAALEHNNANGFIATANPGTPGTTTVLVSRSAGAGGTVLEGTEFIDTRGVRYLSTADVIVPGGAVTNLPIPVATIRETELVNTIDSPILSFVLAAPLGLSITATQPVSGGAMDYLSVLGQERSVFRQDGESDTDYRARVANITDAVSPVAISQATLGPIQGTTLPTPTILETFDDGSTTAVDDDYSIGHFIPTFWEDISSTYAGTSGDPLAYSLDDPSSGLVSRREAAAYFKVLFENPLDAEHENWPPPDIVSALLAVYNSVDAKRAAGVQFDIELNPFTTTTYAGSSTTGTTTSVWTATPPGGKIWWLQSVVLGHIGNTTETPDPDAFHQLLVTYEDATTDTTLARTTNEQYQYGAEFIYSATIPTIVTKRVTQIEGRLNANGPAAPNTKLIGVVRVLEVDV